jgi:hypothetical protein
MGTSVRRNLDNRLVVRSRFTDDPSMQISERRLNYVGANAYWRWQQLRARGNSGPALAGHPLRCHDRCE